MARGLDAPPEIGSTPPRIGGELAGCTHLVWRTNPRYLTRLYRCSCGQIMS